MPYLTQPPTPISIVALVVSLVALWVVLQ